MADSERKAFLEALCEETGGRMGPELADELDALREEAGRWPREVDGRTVWACCASSIGPPCAHETAAGRQTADQHAADVAAMTAAEREEYGRRMAELDELVRRDAQREAGV
jgi:hypothetical protein